MRLEIELIHSDLNIIGDATNSSTESIVVDFREFVKGNRGDKGDRGLSAYDMAVAGGYVGTLEQFSSEAAALANNSGRLTSVENKIIHIDSPLHGLQTGVNCAGGVYYSTNANLIFPGTRTTEVLFRLGPAKDVTQVVFDMYGDASNFRIDINAGNNIRVFLGDPIMNTFSGVEGMSYHIVGAFNSITKERQIFVNGVLFNKANTSNIPQVRYYNIGSTSPAHQHKASNISINKVRTFNEALSDAECTALYNYGDPLNHMLSDALRAKCVAEFLPCGLLLDKWRDTSGNGNDIAAVGTPKLIYQRQAYLTVDKGLRALFVARGAVWNEATGFYELNGLTDITENQMIDIYSASHLVDSTRQDEMCKDNFKIRTLFPMLTTGKGGFTAITADNAYAAARSIEALNLKVGYYAMIRFAFIGCTKLKTVLGIIDISFITSPNYANETFTGCNSLESVMVKGLKLNMLFAQSPNLTRASILYLINNAANTTPITVTLHATASARLTPEDIALASSRNITIA